MLVARCSGPRSEGGGGFILITAIVRLFNDSEIPISNLLLLVALLTHVAITCFRAASVRCRDQVAAVTSPPSFNSLVCSHASMATTPSSRTSVTASRSSQPLSSKPPCTIHPTAIVSDKAQITGTFPVEVGEDTVIHPFARIRAEAGKVVVGRKCVIWEKAVIGAGKAADGDRGDASVILQDYVTVESGASIEASVVGEGSEIGVKAAVGRGVTLGKWCKICPLEVVVGEVEPEVEAFTVVFGDGRRRVDGSAKAFEEVRRAKREGTAKQVEGLRRLIPDASAKWTGVG